MSDDAFRRVTVSVIILAGILVYANTLHYPQFLFDGGLFLKNNPLFKDFDYYAQLLDIKDFSRLDEQLGLSPDVTTNFMLRPVAYLTFSINYLISGFNPAAYRAVNIVIHILNSLLVFACAGLFLRSIPPHRGLSQFSARFIPTASALVFLLHPLQTESVTYITQRFTSLAALFYLTTIWLYLMWSSRERRGTRSAPFRWISVVVLLLGMLARESMFTAPFMIVLLEVTVLGDNLRTAFRRAWPHLMLLPVIPVMVIVVSAAQRSSSLTLSGALNVVNYDAIPVAHYALTQVVVVVTYMRLLLLPYGQNVDPDPPLYTLPYQTPVVLAGLIICSVVGGAYVLFRRNRDDIRCVLVFVGVCWFFLALAVSSSIIPLPDLMAEHRSYLSSIGFIIALVCLLDLLRSRFRSLRANRVAAACVAVWCVTLIVLTYKRNNVWQSPRHLWSDAVKHSPAKERPWFNLGAAYFSSHSYPEALKCFQKAIELSPNWGGAYEMLAKSYLALKRYEDVVAVSLRGIDADPANPVLYNNLGVAYAELGRNEDAKQAFSTAMALRPGYESAMLNLDRLESFMESTIGKRK